MPTINDLAKQYLPNAGAGVDVQAKVAQILEKQNTVAPKLNAAITADRTRLSALGQMQGALDAFRNVAQSMNGGGASTSAASSNGTAISATASAKAAAGNWKVEVQQLASSQVLASKAQAASAAPIGAGAPSVLKIELGKLGATGGFTPNGATARNIVIDGSNNSLDGIAAAINKAGTGVTATVVQGKDGYQLSLKGPSGEAGAMRVTVTGDAALQGLLNHNPAGGKNMTVVSEAKDARFTVNGAAHSSSGNKTGEAIAGVALEFKATGASTVTVARDDAQLAANVEKFAARYNEPNARLETLRQGDLKASTVVRQAESEIEAAMRAVAGTKQDAGMNLAKLGIAVRGNGALEVDKDALRAAVAADAGAVAKFFTDDGRGLADKLASRVAAITDGGVKAEVGRVNRDIESLTAKKAGVEQAMLARANALVKLYSQQTDGTASGILGSIQAPGQNGVPNLFNILG